MNNLERVILDILPVCVVCWQGGGGVNNLERVILDILSVCVLLERES